jgi:hypothetical protein
VTELKVTYRIMDIESKEYQDVVGFGNGADSQDKGSGKASTYSLKNALSKTFMLFSGEDTDNTHSDDIGNYTPPKADKPPYKPSTDKNPSEGKYKCEKCDENISEKVNNFSKSKFGMPLCMDCQKTVPNV